MLHVRICKSFWSWVVVKLVQTICLVLNITNIMGTSLSLVNLKSSSCCWTQILVTQCSNKLYSFETFIWTLKWKYNKISPSQCSLMIPALWCEVSRNLTGIWRLICSKVNPAIKHALTKSVLIFQAAVIDKSGTKICLKIYVKLNKQCRHLTRSWSLISTKMSPTMCHFIVDGYRKNKNMTI